MNGRARTILACIAAALVTSSVGVAQTSLRPSPRPFVIADNEMWYLSGSPIMHAGNIYYPTGPQIHFNANEMVRSGSFEGVPLYSRTTIEPYSMVFVPISGGLMHPYERRRSGDLAGTVGSTVPSFPVIRPAEEDDRVLDTAVLMAPGPGTRMGDPTPRFEDPSAAVVSPGVGTIGTAAVVPLAAAPAPARTRVESVRRPVGLNGVFVLFENQRYFADGPAVRFNQFRLTKAGDHKGFPVYRPEDQHGTIYIPLLDGEPGLLSVYRLR